MVCHDCDGFGDMGAAFSICSYLPQFAVSFIGGVWADRFPRRLLIAGADLGISGVTLIMILFMPMLSEAHALLAALLVLSVVRSVGAGVQTPAVNATVPLLVPADSRILRSVEGTGLYRYDPGENGADH